jgi:hypothetical protein
VNWLGIRHTFWDAMRIFGLRDRLRCPDCKAVGTWKPHGGIFDRADTRNVPRWLCKWCGYYIGPEGVTRAGLGQEAWSLSEPVTPQDICEASFARKVNPWAG